MLSLPFASIHLFKSFNSLLCIFPSLSVACCRENTFCFSWPGIITILYAGKQFVSGYVRTSIYCKVLYNLNNCWGLMERGNLLCLELYSFITHGNVKYRQFSNLKWWDQKNITTDFKVYHDLLWAMDIKGFFLKLEKTNFQMCSDWS